MRAGLFERGKPSSRPLAAAPGVLGSPEHREVARRAVRESLVLLKNNGGLLPLGPGAHVLVAGDGADDIGKQSGGWTITWQGTGNRKSDFPGASSIWDGIREVVDESGGRAVLSPDGSFEEKPDVAIVVFGEDPYAEFQGDRDSIDYSPGDNQDLELLRDLRSEGIPVVSVFLSGRPLWVNPELNASDAFVAAWLPGSEGAGIADVLFAADSGEIRHDFTGKLSFSWPKTPEQVVLNRGDEDYDPLFAYGHGLTYAEEGDLAGQSEETTTKEVISRTVYFQGGPVAPWRLYVGDAVNPSILAAATRVTTQESDNLVLRTVDRRLQEDARAAEWSGGAKAMLPALLRPGGHQPRGERQHGPGFRPDGREGADESCRPGYGVWRRVLRQRRPHPRSRGSAPRPMAAAARAPQVLRRERRGHEQNRITLRLHDGRRARHSFL